VATTRPPLLTARFVALVSVHCAAALASFQLLPAVPFRIRDLGGSLAQSGLFLGVLTYASAATAPFTGALADRVGRRRVLIAAGAFLAALGAIYSAIPSWPLLVALAVPHGLVWSSLLTASSAYAGDLIPVERRAEGIAYHGLGATLAIAVAPSLGFFLAARGWLWLCASIVILDLAVVALALRLPELVEPQHAFPAWREIVDWPVLGLSVTLFLASFGYGGVTSFVAQLAEARGLLPKGLFFVVFAGTIFFSRPLLGRVVDEVGARRALPACVVAIAVGLALLAAARSKTALVVAALVYGGGFSTFYPAFSSYVLDRTRPTRRGAAFGAMLAAFDTGIGSGSIGLGWAIERFGFARAFAAGAALSIFAWPYFLWAAGRFSREEAAGAALARD